MTAAAQVEALVAAHAARLRRLDPLLPAQDSLPAQSETEQLLHVDGAVAVARREQPDPQSLLATWGAATQYRLVPRIASADPASAMASLLRQWSPQVRDQAHSDGPDTEAGVNWPARDPEVAAVLRGYGLSPETVAAVRYRGETPPPGPVDAVVRPLRANEPETFDAAVTLWLEEVSWDARFSTVTPRPSTRAAVSAALTTALTDDRPWAWVAERHGVVAGLVVVEPPEQAGWAAPMVSASPAGYVSCLSVTASCRGAGVGAALASAAHAALAEAGAAVTLLHYAALNPLSGPFWHRHGYRPLWYGWQVSPAGRLGRGGG